MSNIQSDLYLAFTDNPEPKVEFLHWLAVASGLPDNLKQLDIGCGPGHFLPYFASYGWSVRGMEPDEGFFEAACERVESKEVNVVRGGFDEITEQESYDLITAINAPFAYMLFLTEQARALQKCFDALRPGGVLFLEVPNMLWFLANLSPDKQMESTTRGKKVVLKRRYEIDYHDALVHVKDHYEWYATPEITESVAREDTMAVLPVPYLFYLLRETGFVQNATYTSYHARVPGRVAGRDILISARKPQRVHRKWKSK